MQHHRDFASSSSFLVRSDELDFGEDMSLHRAQKLSLNRVPEVLQNCVEARFLELHNGHEWYRLQVVVLGAENSPRNQCRSRTARPREIANCLGLSRGNSAIVRLLSAPFSNACYRPFAVLYHRPLSGASIGVDPAHAV